MKAKRILLLIMYFYLILTVFQIIVTLCRVIYTITLYKMRNTPSILECKRIKHKRIEEEYEKIQPITWNEW